MSSIDLEPRGSKSRVISPNIDCQIVRGRHLKLDELLTTDLTSANLIAAQRAEFCCNQPFAHIVIDGLFNEELLTLIDEEFPASETTSLCHVSGQYEATHRSKGATDLGHA